MHEEKYETKLKSTMSTACILTYKHISPFTEGLWLFVHSLNMCSIKTVIFYILWTVIKKNNSCFREPETKNQILLRKASLDIYNFHLPDFNSVMRTDKGKGGLNIL